MTHCLAYELRKPDFHQDNDFRIALWQPEEQESVQENSNIIRLQKAERRKILCNSQ